MGSGSVNVKTLKIDIQNQVLEIIEKAPLETLETEVLEETEYMKKDGLTRPLKISL
ncbi:Uncharacterised protein [Streptococcus pneumoniae]|nr:Uncharacterised protein [Streptococcus pneumoniae]CVZ82405.1 Uncharacterised protein [Streptococcus pneumoniae]